MKLSLPETEGLFHGKPILAGDGWSLSMTFRKWRIEKVVDSIGRYIRVGPVLFEYDYVDTESEVMMETHQAL